MQNNWYVITGAPCSGKTTVLVELEKKGYRVVYEAARTVIDNEIKRGKTLQQIRKDELAFQKKVLKLKIKIEKSLPKDELIFFERGIPDSTAYYKLCGVTNDRVLQETVQNSIYKKVFVFDLLKFEADYSRTETSEQAKVIHSLLADSYKELNMPVIRVTVMPVEQRVEFIINNLSEI